MIVHCNTLKGPLSSRSQNNVRSSRSHSTWLWPQNPNPIILEKFLKILKKKNPKNFLWKITQETKECQYYWEFSLRFSETDYSPENGFGHFD